MAVHTTLCSDYKSLHDEPDTTQSLSIIRVFGVPLFRSLPGELIGSRPAVCRDGIRSALKNKGEGLTDHEVVWSNYGYEGKLINVRLDTIRLNEGRQREREIVEHPGAVAIVPVLNDGRIVLVRQHRPAVGKSLLELPAGTVEPDEDTAVTAARELAEETGYRASGLRELLRFYVSPGWCNEELVVYVATGLTAGEPDTEDDEEIDVEAVEVSRVPQLIREGEIGDAKTMVGIGMYSGLKLDPE